MARLQQGGIFILTFLILHAGSHISLLAQRAMAVSDIYLPTAVGIILIYWIRPGLVVGAMFLNAVSTSYFWGTPAEKWPLWFVYAIPETVYLLLSWYIFKVVLKGRFWLPDIHNTVLFLFVGILIPALPEALLLQGLLVWFGDQPMQTYWLYVSSNILSEFATIFFVTLPALYYLSPYLQRKGFLVNTQELIPSPPAPARSTMMELGGIFFILASLVFFLEFREHWYVYGFFSLFVAIRHGFGPAIVTNFYILLITYVFPKFIPEFGQQSVNDFSYVHEVFLGANFLFVFVAVTGRVISDLRDTESRLMNKNRQLQKANDELDQFVYSVSHDLSAPLKSIRGLVNISRLTDDKVAHIDYLNRIEQSVLKLETFIDEILDYSRNHRHELVPENIDLEQLCKEILSNLALHMPIKPTIIYTLKERFIFQDRTRLKIILTNLLSNAFTYQKKNQGHQPVIQITSAMMSGNFHISIEDNGEGITEDAKPRIFEMFYRGNVSSGGSGLGLYIAREAAHRIGGEITFTSVYGKGSVFHLNLLNQG